jgi:SAM-dependent methyltransferase
VTQAEPYYRRDLARVHHEGFSFHAAKVAPGVLALLEPVRAAGGLLVEFGCGSGLLTRELIAAGHRVIASDASPAMVELAREVAPGAEGYVVLALPDDPLPAADAIVGVGHPINYLPSLEAIHAAVVGMAGALRPGGLLAFDICDLAYGARTVDGMASRGWVGDDWALITEFSAPSPDRFVREMTIFSRNDDGTWRRDHERHDNVLLDVTTVPPLLAEHGVVAEVRDAFGSERLPPGLKVIVGRKAG